MLKAQSEPYDKDCRTIINTIKYSTWYNQLIVEDIAIKDAGVAAIAELFSRKTEFTVLVLENNKAKSIGTLSRALKLGVHSLVELTLTKNNIGDAGITELTQGLTECTTIKVLSLQACGFTGRGFQELFTMLLKKEWREGLKVLEVADNKAGKVGSKALEAWAENTKGIQMALQRLNLDGCDLDVELVVTGLVRNKGCRELKTVNISHNKFTSKSADAVAKLITATENATAIFMSHVGLSRAGFIKLIDAVIENPHGLRFHLDFTGNDLGARGAKELLQHLQKWADKVMAASSGFSSLIVADNNLGSDGLLYLCNGVAGTKIESLKAGNNVKVGVFGSGKDIAEGIANLVKTTPALKELDLCGDEKHYLKNLLDPLFTLLSTNTTLKTLKISRNRLPEASVRLLAQAIKDNRTLTSLDCQRNRLTLEGLKMLSQAVCGSPVMRQFQTPMYDIKAMLSDSSANSSELRTLINQLEQHVEVEEEASINQKSSYLDGQKEKRRRMSKLNTASREFDKMVADNFAALADEAMKEVREGEEKDSEEEEEEDEDDTKKINKPLEEDADLDG